MEALIASAIGVLMAAGVYLLLRARTFDVILGLTLLSYAVNLFVFSMGRLRAGVAPVVTKGVPLDPADFTDPLPQALVLTAIVIGFALTSLSVVLAIRAHMLSGDDLTDTPGTAP
jgi:multicomponent K+:H+ antiporter subunit C